MIQSARCSTSFQCRLSLEWIDPERCQALEDVQVGAGGAGAGAEPVPSGEPDLPLREQSAAGVGVGRRGNAADPLAAGPVEQAPLRGRIVLIRLRLGRRQPRRYAGEEGRRRPGWAGSPHLEGCLGLELGVVC